MSRVSAVLRKVDGGYSHWCPACQAMHFIRTEPDEDWKGAPMWTFDGNVDRPTFTPSVSITWGDQPGSRRCHYNITAGEIVFHGDCTHNPMKGTTVPMPPLPARLAGEIPETRK